jgi:hypothetical protein
MCLFFVFWLLLPIIVFYSIIFQIFDIREHHLITFINAIRK